MISNYQTKLGPSFLVFQFRPLALAASRELWFAVNQWRGLVIQAATEDEVKAECERSAERWAQAEMQGVPWEHPSATRPN